MKKRLWLPMVLLVAALARGSDIYVSPGGDNANPGTLEKPVSTLTKAQELARVAGREGAVPVNVWLRGGTYYLGEPLVFTAADSGSATAPVVYQAYRTEKPVISGGVKLSGLNWKPYKNGILETAVPADLKTDQLFVNGECQVLARYPNYDPKEPIYHGYAADAIDPARVARWAAPTGGFFHAMHPGRWGGFSYVISGKTPDGQVILDGGWQNNRPVTPGSHFVGAPPRLNAQYRFVEGIFEELDAPGEWFLNTKTHTLYFYPPKGLDLSNALVESVRLKELIGFRGTQQAPVKFVSLKGITFREALRTFMETKEPVVRSDWTLYRGGAVFLTGTEDCSIEDSDLTDLGGNAIFVSNYNRRAAIRGCHIHDIGGNGVVFLGDPAAAYNSLFQYKQGQSFVDISKTPGPKTDNYPGDCLLDDCLIHQTGGIEMQSAPVDIDLARAITVRHCSIYDCPRAGINIGDGCWGADVIEFCDVFDTVEATSDNGSFNSWGRDRWWKLHRPTKDFTTTIDMPGLDAVQPVILRNNRWRCDHGWDIDLDDGSTHFEITNNLCLHGGLKTSSGYSRVVKNNITVDSTLSLDARIRARENIWPLTDANEDVYGQNIVWKAYTPLRIPPNPWGEKLDNDFLQVDGATGVKPATALQDIPGHDIHALAGDALFVDPAHGDYRVKDGSPALALGFKNFPMDQFGVQKPELKALARTPELPLPGETEKSHGTH